MKIINSINYDVNYEHVELEGDIQDLEDQEIETFEIAMNNDSGVVIKLTTTANKVYSLDVRAYWGYPIYLKFKRDK